jgi:signal transduction histidine kinase
MTQGAALPFFDRSHQHLKRIYAWPRVRVVAPVCAVVILLFSIGWEAPYWMLVFRLSLLGFLCLTIFGITEVWPQRLPRWFARWAFQVVAVAITVPLAVTFAYTVTTLGLDPPWWRDKSRLEAVFAFTFLGMIIAPWMAVAALLKQIKEDARRQALQFQLERSELERSALNARLDLLQAQVQPHFLFNTLANVRELVVMGSPRAAVLLEHLIAYLRAAVPRINDAEGTVAEEMERVRAYLEIMHMRMPDRLQFSFDISLAAAALPCLPMSALTLVENAVRHGIDPAESGGRVDVSAAIHNGALTLQVRDTGVGLARASAPMGGASLGTGIRNLRERLRLAFGDDASVTITANAPRGVTATMRVPISTPLMP